MCGLHAHACIMFQHDLIHTGVIMSLYLGSFVCGGLYDLPGQHTAANAHRVVY